MNIREGQFHKIIILSIVFTSVYLNLGIGIENNDQPDNFEYLDLPSDYWKLSSSNLVKGGSNFTSATTIFIGSTNGSFDDQDGYYEYFKINLNASSTIIFTVIINTTINVSIYDPSMQFINVDSTKDVLHVQITVVTAGYYYIELIRPELILMTNFTIVITDSSNGPIGSDTLNSAVLISPGTFSNNFTTSQSDQYFKIFLANGTDVYINVFGECNNLVFYNSSNYVLDQNPIINPAIKLSIIQTDYYYIGVSHVTTNSGIMTITVTNQFSQNVFYADGGDSFSSATLIPFGTIQNHITTIENSDYYKISLNMTNIVTLTLTSLSSTSSPNTYLYLYIYQPNQMILTYGEVYTPQSGTTPSINQLVLTPSLNDTYYLVVKYDNPLEYKITVSSSNGGSDGGDNFATATNITTGIYSGYLTNDELSDYYKIFLPEGYDVNITVLGEYNIIFLYNSSTHLIEQSSVNPFIIFSITVTDYYFIRLFHSTSDSGSYTLSVTTQSSGSIIFIDGGDSFDTASLVPFGTIQNDITGKEGSDIYKVFSSTSQIISFYMLSLSLTPTTDTTLYLYIYDSNLTQMMNYEISRENAGSRFNYIFLEITSKANSTYYFKISYKFYLNYKITFSTIVDEVDGGNDSSSATIITTNYYTGHLTSEEDNDYFKIMLYQGNDLIVDSSTTVYLYNESNFLLEKGWGDPSITRSIDSTGYYYIRIVRTNTYLVTYSLSISTEVSGNIFFADGGESFDNATLLSTGTTQNRFIYNEFNDFFKIPVFGSKPVIFEIDSITKIYSSYSDIYFHIFGQNKSLMTSSHFYEAGTSYTPTLIRLVLTPNLNETYYFQISCNSTWNYRIRVEYSFYPSQPRNVEAIFNNISNILSITWTDSDEHDLKYLIYMSYYPITRLDKTARFLSSVSSGVQKYEIQTIGNGNYYFAVIANNSDGIMSPLELGVSSTSKEINVINSFPSISTSTNSGTGPSWAPNTRPITNENNNNLLNLIIWIISLSMIAMGGYFIYHFRTMNKNYVEEENQLTISEENIETQQNDPNSENIILEDIYNIEQIINTNDEIYKKIQEGNFENYSQLLEAEQIGAKNIFELQLVKKLNAPDYLTAVKIMEGNFESYEQYDKALYLGANTLDELLLVESTNAPNCIEAKKVRNSGFSDFQSYTEAISDGFLDFESWKLYHKRNQQFNDYIIFGLDVSKENFMKELEIKNSDEFLDLLNKLNLSLKGGNILISEINTDLDTNLILKEFTIQNSNNKYNEFNFRKKLPLTQLIEECKICFKPLIGMIGSCPKCFNDTHYFCLTDWVIGHKSCPTCRQDININDILISDRSNPNSCFLCKKTFIENEKIISCEKCQVTYHQSEFLEWIKVKGYCPNCGLKIIF